MLKMLATVLFVASMVTGATFAHAMGGGSGGGGGGGAGGGAGGGGGGNWHNGATQTYDSGARHNGR